MIDLSRLLQNEYDRLHRIKEITEQRLKQNEDIEGKLRIATRKNQVSFYHRLPKGKSNGEYLQKNQNDFAQRLAQKTYDVKILKLVTRREKQFQRILKDYRVDEIQNVYLNESPIRQELITPVEPTWEQLVDEWQKGSYQKKPFSENAPIILTNRGERVRSKSEKILADFFDQNNIPYKYECPLFLKPYGIVYPDFTFLSRKTGREIYWEHEGRMDDLDYARKAIKKIDLYQTNDILVGDRLILTFESSSSVLNTEIIRKLVNHYLL